LSIRKLMSVVKDVDLRGDAFVHICQWWWWLCGFHCLGQFSAFQYQCFKFTYVTRNIKRWVSN